MPRKRAGRNRADSGTPPAAAAAVQKNGDNGALSSEENEDITFSSAIVGNDAALNQSTEPETLVMDINYYKQRYEESERKQCLGLEVQKSLVDSLKKKEEIILNLQAENSELKNTSSWSNRSSSLTKRKGERGDRGRNKRAKIRLSVVETSVKVFETEMKYFTIINLAKDLVSSTESFEDSGRRSYRWIDGISAAIIETGSSGSDSDDFDPDFQYGKPFLRCRTDPCNAQNLKEGFPVNPLKSARRGEFFDGEDRVFADDKVLESFIANGFEIEWENGNMAEWLDEEYPAHKKELTEMTSEQRLKCFHNVAVSVLPVFKEKRGNRLSTMKKNSWERFLKGIGLPVMSNNASRRERVDNLKIVGKRILELIPDLDFDLYCMEGKKITNDLIKAPRNLDQEKIDSFIAEEAMSNTGSCSDFGSVDIFSKNNAYRNAAILWTCRDGPLKRPETPSISGLARCDATLFSYCFMAVLKLKLVEEAESLGGKVTNEKGTTTKETVIPESQETVTAGSEIAGDMIAETEKDTAPALSKTDVHQFLDKLNSGNINKVFGALSKQTLAKAMANLMADGHAYIEKEFREELDRFPPSTAPAKISKEDENARVFETASRISRGGRTVAFSVPMTNVDSLVVTAAFFRSNICGYIGGVPNFFIAEIPSEDEDSDKYEAFEVPNDIDIEEVLVSQKVTVPLPNGSVWKPGS